MIQGTGMGCHISRLHDILIVHSANLFNYINLSHPDTSGMLRFLTDELQDAEDNGDRGMSRCPPDLRLLTFSTSLDHGSRSQWLGWVKCTGGTK